MPSSPHLDWPFFEPHHKTLAAELDQWASAHLSGDHNGNVDDACRELVRQLGTAGWLNHAIGGKSYGATSEAIDTRAICLIRETLARHAGLADFAFAMQGLGSGAITLFGTAEQKKKYLPRVAKGEAIAAFALSELNAGSDVAAMQCDARRDGDGYILNGDKTWISNGGIAAKGRAASARLSSIPAQLDSKLENASRSSLRTRSRGSFLRIVACPAHICSERRAVASR